MERIFRRKLLVPNVQGCIVRPRLLNKIASCQGLLIQAPAGAGKTVFITQFLAKQGSPAVYYQMDEQDQNSSVFASHILAGFKDEWSDWQPPKGLEKDPRELAMEIVSEAADRTPFTLVLDQAESAFGQPYFADFISIIIRYAPPEFILTIGSRAPLAIEHSLLDSSVEIIKASDLALTEDEVQQWLGPGNWQDCFSTTGGFPLAMKFWQQAESKWKSSLTNHMLACMPTYISSDVGKALIEEWLSNNMTLENYAHQVSWVVPGEDQLWREIHQARALFGIDPLKTLEGLKQLWENTRDSGNRFLAAAAAMLYGEVYYGLGDYGLAMEWYRQAFEADPALELGGAHSLVLLLRDQGHLDEAESLARRSIEARSERGDLQSLAFAHLNYGAICVERGRLEEAEREYEITERLGLKLSGNKILGVLAILSRAMLEGIQGNATAFRRSAEEAYAHFRGQVPFLEAISGYILAEALFYWGERDAAQKQAEKSLQYLTQINAKYHLHVLHTILARAEWMAGRKDEARAYFDKTLELAAQEGYLQYLQFPRRETLPLVIDALLRGVEVSFLQELLVRMEKQALSALLQLVKQPEARARQVAIYPLATIGGKEAENALQKLLHDPEKMVQDSAMVAVQSINRQKKDEPTLEVPPKVSAKNSRASISIMGSMVVSINGEQVRRWRMTKSRDLLAYLIVNKERPVTREQIIDALWPDSEFDAANSQLHSALYHLRRILKPASQQTISFAGGAYRLNRECFEIDIDLFQNLAEKDDEVSWRKAVELYHGDLLEGLEYQWCEALRTRIRNIFLDTLRKLADYHQQGKQWNEAIEFLQLLIQVDPLAEDGHHELVKCYAALGNRNAALQQYRTLVRILDEELGLVPNEELQALYRKIID